MANVTVNCAIKILGNEYLNKLTEQGYYKLRIDMWDFDNNHRYAIYNTFVVKHEMSGYKLEVADYTGNAGNVIRANSNRLMARGIVEG